MSIETLSYQEFLTSKSKNIEPSGFKLDRKYSGLPEDLFEFQLGTQAKLLRTGCLKSTNS